MFYNSLRKNLISAVGLLEGFQIRSDQISHSVVSDSLRPHESHPSPADLPDPGIEP